MMVRRTARRKLRTLPRDPRWSLTDQHGPWCAWCLDYFDPRLLQNGQWIKNPRSRFLIEPGDLREAHHVVSQNRIPERAPAHEHAIPLLLPPSFPSTWTVDAHVSCHRLKIARPNLQTFADASAGKLQWLAERNLLAHPHLQALDAEAAKAHDTGLYSIAVFINDIVRRHLWASDAREAALRSFEFQLASLAGVHGEMPVQNLVVFGGDQEKVRPRSLLHVANHLSNVGRLENARDVFTRAQELLGSLSNKARAEFEIDVMLREAQILRNPASAAKLIHLGASLSAYSQQTAKVFSGMLALSDDPRKSQDYFQSLLHGEQEPSWLYRAEAWFGIAYYCLSRSGTNRTLLEEAYRLLVAAQYAFVMLRLQPTPRTGLQGLPTDCMPFDLLQHDRFKEIGRRQARELRLEAIIERGMRHELFGDLAGWALGQTATVAFRPAVYS